MPEAATARARRRRGARRLAPRQLPHRAPARPVALADPAADQGRPTVTRYGARRPGGDAPSEHAGPDGPGVRRRRAASLSGDARGRGAAAPHRLRGPGPRRARQAGGDGRPPGRRAQQRHARQRAAPPREGSERHRRRAAAGHRAPARPRHVGRDGRREERPGAPGAVAAVPRSRGREGVHRARLGRRPRRTPDRRADRPRPGSTGRRCRRGRGARGTP